MPVISIRVSDEWLGRVDAACERLRWKRNAVIVNFVWDVLEAQVMRGCPECGALNGMHQRGCKQGGV